MQAGSRASTLSAGPLPIQLTPHENERGRAFALEPVSNRIFLTAHDPVSPPSGGAVFVYDIGLNTETQIIPAAGSDPDTGYWDIEIDPVGQRIWYTAPGAGEIRSAKFDGSDVQVELSGLSNPYGLALELVHDTDGDGVNDDVDLCPGTVIPEGVPTRRLNPNPWALVDGDFVFDTVRKGKGNGNGRSYNTTDTGGCSCEQIIAAQGLGRGHTKHGCSISAMDDWVALVAGLPKRDVGQGAIEAVAEVPETFTLENAYPNPFNPQTTIGFGLPESAHVRLVVYDVLGRPVRVLLDATREAGAHQVIFDATDLPSGTYLYQLVTPEGGIVKMMQLVK